MMSRASKAAWTGMPNSVMILVVLTVAPSWLRKFPKKTNFLIEVFPFRGLLIVEGSIASKSLDRCLQCGRSTAHLCRTPWNCWREPPSGRSPKEKWQITKILREVFLTAGPLSIWGGVHVDISRRPGEAVSYANAGERFRGLSWRGKVNGA